MTLRPVTPHDLLAQAVSELRIGLAELGGHDALQELAGRADALARGLSPYVESHTSPPSADLRALEQATRAVDWPERHARGDTSVELESEMLCGPVEARFLATLVAMSGARRVLEIGLFTGYSALAMAEALPDGGTLLALEREPWLADFARAHFSRSEHGHKIEVRVGPAADALERLAGDHPPFDLVFIDADKGGYVGYLDRVLDGLLAPGGTVVVDNSLLQGQPWLEERSTNGEAIDAFNRRVRDDPGLEQIIVPLRDGVSLVRRRHDPR